MLTSLDIPLQRMHNQRIARPNFTTPVDVVQWMGAVQAQDFSAAKWALGLRTRNTTADVIEQAFAEGAILRTHVMRPTWHFISPADTRWMLALTAPRVYGALAYYDQQLQLDSATCLRSHNALAKALQGGKHLTRPELASVLQQVGIVTEPGQRMTHLMMHAELDGIICSGARRGKQFTYTLLDERVPQTPMLARDEAMAQLVKRYFTSHGPATLQDFIWWSGLTGSEAKAGLDMNASHLLHENINGQTYWFADLTSIAQETTPIAYLIPNFDEYTVSYKDRSTIVERAHTNKRVVSASEILSNVLILDGQVVGTWKRTLTKDTVFIVLNPFISLDSSETQAVAVAAERYAAFVGLPVRVTYQEA